MLKKENCSSTELVPRLGGMFCGEKLLVGFLLMNRGAVIDPATFVKSKLDDLIKDDKLIGMLEPWSFENNDQEADTATSVRKEQIETIPGTKGYNAMFTNGTCFQNELQKLHSTNAYDFVPVFEDGSALFAQKRDGTLRGFAVRLFTGTKQLQVSADVAGSTLRIFINPSSMSDWQGAGQIYYSDEFSFKDITPVAGLKIELPALVAAAVKTDVTVTELCKGSSVSGLTTASNWKMERNGVLEAITGTVTEVNGVYSMTHAAFVTGDKIRFLTDNLGFPVVVLDTLYYAGSSEIETVV